MVKPGYTDSAAMQGASVIQEVAPTPDTPKEKEKAADTESLTAHEVSFCC